MPHPLIQPPQPILTAWGYGYEGAEAFHRHAREYQKQAHESLNFLLKIYLQEVRSQMTGTQYPSTPEHARWMALRFAGLTYGEIVEHERKHRRDAPPRRQVIQRAVIAFARRVGVTPPGSH